MIGWLATNAVLIILTAVIVAVVATVTDLDWLYVVSMVLIALVVGSALNKMGNG